MELIRFNRSPAFSLIPLFLPSNQAYALLTSIQPFPVGDRPAAFLKALRILLLRPPWSINRPRNQIWGSRTKRFDVLSWTLLMLILGIMLVLITRYTVMGNGRFGDIQRLMVVRDLPTIAGP